MRYTPGGAKNPHLAYSLKAVPSKEIHGLNLVMAGETLTYEGSTNVSREFTWRGSTNDRVLASVRVGNSTEIAWFSAQGSWAVFRFFNQADRWQARGSGYRLGWIIRSGQSPTTIGGEPLTVRIDLDVPEGPPLLQSGYFKEFACVAPVAR